MNVTGCDMWNSLQTQPDEKIVQNHNTLFFLHGTGYINVHRETFNSWVSGAKMVTSLSVTQVDRD
jgi:hypothetical protein